MALFNNQKYSDLVLMFNGNPKQKLFCHKMVLINGSNYLENLLEEKKSTDSEINIRTEYADLDIQIIKFLYEHKISLDNYETLDKIKLAFRAEFYSIIDLKEQILKNIYKQVTPDDLKVLIEHNDILPIDKEKITKYLRLFLIQISKDNLLEKINKIDGNIIKNLLIELIKSPSIFAQNEQTIGDFYNSHQCDVTHKSFRNITKNEIDKYSYLDKIEGYKVLTLDHYIIYKIILQFKLDDIMCKLNFESMSQKNLQIIHDNTLNVKICITVGNIIINREIKKNNNEQLIYFSNYPWKI